MALLFLRDSIFTQLYGLNWERKPRYIRDQLQWIDKHAKDTDADALAKALETSTLPGHGFCGRAAPFR